MGVGIRVEIRVEDPGTCPVATVSDVVDQPISTISWSAPDDTATVVEEFTTQGTSLPSSEGLHDSIETVFETDRYSRHRFSHTPEHCVCRQIEQLGSPVETVRAVDGGLTISFYVMDTAEVNDIITTLRRMAEGVKLRRLHRVAGPEAELAAGDDLVWVDRGALTDRQREVLETAHEMGYFEYPRRSNATAVADAVGIGPSTFREHLAAAQSKLLDAVLSADE